MGVPRVKRTEMHGGGNNDYYLAACVKDTERFPAKTLDTASGDAVNWFSESKTAS